MTRVLAIVPARAGSKRLPGKNLRGFLGKPLIHWTIEFARAESRFSEVLVSTDSESIARVARDAGASVPWLRPAELASDSASTVDVVLHALASYADTGQHFDYVAILQPTTPVRFNARWLEALHTLDAGAPAALGVIPALSHPYWAYKFGDDGVVTPFFPDGVAMRSQVLPKAFVANGSLYLARCAEVKAQRTIVPAGVRGILCDDPVESIDIDTQADWDEAEHLVRAHRERLS